jgi:hypothetical protein
MLHDGLLKAWSHHGLRSRFLASTPDRRSIRRLGDTFLLGVRGLLDEGGVLVSHRGGGEGIGARDGRGAIPRVGVVRGYGVVGGGAVQSRGNCPSAQGGQQSVSAPLQHGEVV